MGRGRVTGSSASTHKQIMYFNLTRASEFENSSIKSAYGENKIFLAQSYLQMK